MPEFSFIPGSLLLSSTFAYAGMMTDIIDCDAKKAVRNSAMEIPVGVSGRCDPKKAAGETKKDAVHIYSYGTILYPAGSVAGYPFIG